MFLILISIYFVIVIVIYFAMGGFYFSRSTNKQQGYDKRLTNEFVSVDHNQVFKGIYAGISDSAGEKHYLLQFPDLLIGSNRYVNIYYSLDDTVSPSVIESSEKLKGDNAYLILNPFGYYGGNNISFDKVFGPDTLTNPKEFLDTINEKIENAHDTLFISALTVMENDIQVQMMMWTKADDSTYHAKRFQDLKYAWANTGNCKINKVKRSSSGKGLNIILAGFIDIITAPIQSIVILVYFIAAILSGGGVR